MLGRRTFITALAAVFQAAIAFVLCVPGLRVLLAPLRRKSTTESFIRIARLSILKEDRPVAVAVRSDRTDAFLHYPTGTVGHVWLTAGAAKDPSSVRCFQSICPHLGCGVDFDVNAAHFTCPCHGAVFAANGERLAGPSPRDLDELPCRISPADANGDRWIEVQYRKFRTGVAQQDRIA